MFKPFIASLLFVVAAANAQNAAVRPAFEVASVKPAAPLDMQKLMADMTAGKAPKIGPRVNEARAEYTYMSLTELIALAYKVKANQISGPAWLATERFDIAAKIPDGASKDDAPVMLQALLEERFKLIVRREAQEKSVLGLLIGSGGPKLMESPPAAPIDENAPLKPGERKLETPDGPVRVTQNADGSSTINMGTRGTMTQRMDMEAQMLHLEASQVTMDAFAEMLSSFTRIGGGNGRQVVDMTGLKGNYQIAVDLSLADLIAMARAMGIDKPEFQTNTAVALEPDGGGTVNSAVQALGPQIGTP